MIKKRIQIDMDRFRRFRERHGITVSEIADEIGVAHRVIYSWIDLGWPDDAPSRFNHLASILSTTRQSLRRSIQKK